MVAAPNLRSEPADQSIGGLPTITPGTGQSVKPRARQDNRLRLRLARKGAQG
jgi:hypothetical protein